LIKSYSKNNYIIIIFYINISIMIRLLLSLMLRDKTSDITYNIIITYTV